MSVIGVIRVIRVIKVINYKGFSTHNEEGRRRSIEEYSSSQDATFLLPERMAAIVARLTREARERQERLKPVSIRNFHPNSFSSCDFKFVNFTSQLLFGARIFHKPFAFTDGQFIHTFIPFLSLLVTRVRFIYVFIASFLPI